MLFLTCKLLLRSIFPRAAELLLTMQLFSVSDLEATSVTL